MARQARVSGIPVQDLFDNNPLPMWVYDLSTLAFLAVNAAAVRLYGYSREEFLAMTIKEIRPPEDLPALLEKVARTVDGYDAAGTWRHRKKDGTIFDVEIVSHTLRFSGRPAKLILANDVTERGRLGRELQRSADEWRQTFDAMSDAVALIDADGVIRRCNRAMTILARKAYHEIVGHYCWEVVHGTSGRVPGCPVQEMLLTHRRATATMPAGAQIFRVVADPLFDASGRFTGAVHIMTDVTQQEHDNKVLHEAVLQQQAILDNIPDIAWLKDDQGRLLAVNEPFGRASGFAPADLVGKTDLDVWPRELAERYRADDAEVVRSRSRKVVEEPLADKEGITAWIETIKTPIVDEGGRVIGTTGIARDITARKQTEAALQASEKRFRTLFEAANDAIFIVDMAGRCLDLNAAAYERLGYSREEMLARSVAELVTPEFAARVPERIAEIHAHGRAVFESAHLRKDGTVMPVEVNAVVVDHDGREVIYSIVRDITARKIAEAVIRESEERYRDLFENASDAIFLLDARQTVLDANRKAEELTGYTADELRALSVFEMLPPDQPAAAAAESGKPATPGAYEKFEGRVRRKDGACIDVEVSTSAIVKDGRLVGSRDIVRDVTERKRAERQLRDSRLLYDKTLASLDESVFVVDIETRRILDCNPATEKIFGYSREELLDRDTRFLHVNDEMFSTFAEQKLPALAEQGQAEFEFRMKRKNGEVFPTEHFLRPLQDDAGRTIGVVSVVRDISVRKRAEAAILEQKAFTEQLIQGSSAATFVINDRHEVVLWNKACEELTGVAAATIIGSAEAWRPFYEESRPVLADLVLDPDEGVPSEFYSAVSPSVLMPEGLHAERWFKGLNGSDRFIAFDAAPVRDGSGRIVAAIETIQDLTMRKRAEERIAESEERYRNLFDNASDMIQSVAPDGRFLYVNAAWRNVLGYSEDDLRSITMFDVIHPSCRTSYERHFAKVMSGATIDFLEAKFVAKDGRIVEVEGSANARLIDGECVSTQGIFRDVTERKTLREEIYRISHDWEETFDTLTDMVTVHDHEFTIIRANKAAEKILGLPFLNTKSVKCFEYYHGTGCPPAGCPSCASLVTGKPSVSEIYEPHLGRHLEIRAIPRFDSAGHITGLIHVVRDITERARAEETKKEQMRLAEFGMHVGTALNHEGTAEEILGACTDLLVKDLSAAFARIWTVSPDGKTLVLQASSGLYTHRDGPHGRIPIDEDLKIPVIARTRKAHLTNRVIGDPQVNQEWAVREGMVAFAGYPLQVGAHLVGVMGLFSRQELSDFTLNALESVAQNIATGIERIQGDIAMQRYSENLAALNTASTGLLALASIPKIYEGICRFAEQVFGVELVWLGLIDADDSDVKIASFAGVGEEYLRTLKVTLDDSPTGRGPTGLAFRSKQPWVARTDAPEFAPWRAAAEQQGFESSLAVPLLAPTAAGTCIGALNFYSRSADHFTPDRVRLCQIFANQAAIAIENARLIAGLEETVFNRTFALEAANIELQHLNKELEQRRLEAESASRSKSDFLANMSHELRTPLNAIIGFSDILVRGMAGPLAEKPKEYLGDILAGGKHLLSLINDILDLSKVEAGKMEIEPAPYDLAELVDRCLSLFREKALKHRLDLRAQIEGALAPLHGDERKIRQVLYNLLSNAVKFTPDGGAVVVRARTVREEGGGYAEISVSDTGIGISPEDQQRLFRPFSQLSHHLTKEHEGTGLGLALCKSYVEMHGGRIGVESAPGRGSTFTLSIPLHYDRGGVT